MNIEKIWNTSNWTTHARNIINGLTKFSEDSKLILILRHSHRNDLKPEDIQRVDLYLNKNSFIVVVEPEDRKRAPQNVPEAMHSIYFGVAVAIIRRKAFIDEHTESWLQSPQVHYDTVLLGRTDIGECYLGGEKPIRFSIP